MARIEAELTVEQVAVMIGRSFFTIRAYETGAVEPPVRILAQLAQLYGTTLDAIVSEPGPEAVAHA